MLDPTSSSLLLASSPPSPSSAEVPKDFLAVREAATAADSTFTTPPQGFRPPN